MSFRLLNQAPVYLNQQGKPCAGGSLLTFDSGTSNPADTYSDPALTVTNGSVVALDASGRTAVDVWATGVLRVVLKDSLGVVQWTLDNVSASSEVPDQSGNTGKYLTTNGTFMLWGAIAQVPSVTGQSGKFLTNNGTDPAYWASLTPSTNNLVFQNDREKVQTINFTADGALAIDFTLGGVVLLNQSANITALTVTGMTNGDGCNMVIRRIKDNSATARTIVFSAAFKWGEKTAPTLTQTANGWDEFSLLSIDGGVTLGVSVMPNVG